MSLTGQQAIDGYLAYKGTSKFYSSSTPGFGEQEGVYTSSSSKNSVAVSFLWQAK
jgi:hypothetical protein